MLKSKLILLLLTGLALLALAPEDARAQGCGSSNPNCIVPTAPNGTNTNQAASTAFVQNALAGGSSIALANNKFLIGGLDGLAHAMAISGDCVTTNAGLITCTKTNGVAFAPSATTDTTNAANISSGNLSVNRLNGGASASASTMWRGDGSWAAPQAMPFTPTNASPAATTMQQQMQRMPVMCETYSGGCTTANITTAIQDSIINTRCYQLNSDYNLTSNIVIDAANLGGHTNPCFTGRGSFVGPASGTQSAVIEFKNVTGITVDGNIAINCSGNAYIGAALKIWGTTASGSFQAPNFSKIANCRQAIGIGDTTQSTVAISEIILPSNLSFFNVAQGVRSWSSNAVVDTAGMVNNVDPHTSGNWALTGTGTCTTSTVTISSPGANSYFDQYDKITGTGIVAGSYITGQVSGTAGGAGVYNLSTTGNSCSAAAITGEKRGINYWTSGGTINIVGGEAINAVVNDGILCVTDVMVSPNSYGNCSFTGVAIEAGGQIAASFNPTGVVSPTGGGIALTGSRGFVGGLTTTDAIVADANFPGNISVSNNRIFGTSSRSGFNITANNAATPIYFDLGSFGVNMLQGYAGISGGTQYIVGADGQASPTVVSTTSAQGKADTYVIFNGAGTITYTMLNPATYPGRELILVNNANQAVNSASSNIVGLTGSSGTSILAGTAGKFVRLRADVGASAWRVISSN